MGELLLRDAEPADADAMVAIALAAWEPYFAWLRERMGGAMFECFHPDWRAEKRRHVTDPLAADRPGEAIVAERDGEVVGFVCHYARAEAGWAEISNNAVRPDCQGQGIGPPMYEEAISRMRRMGLRHVRVDTGGDEFHARARRAYEKCGFTVPVPGVTYHRAL